MTPSDIVGLVASYVYAFGLLLIVEAIGKWLKWPSYFTRKLVHIGAGMWIWGILALFDTWYIGIIPFATFIVLNYIFYRLKVFKAMDGEAETLGTVYFAISITILFALLWRTGGGVDRVPLAAAAVMVMTVGDAMASIVGKRWGQRSYTYLGHTRTWEGTIAMAIFSFLSLLLTLRFLPGSSLSPHSIPYSTPMLLQLSVMGTVIATIAEAISPAGTDNLTVPLCTGLVLVLITLAN